MFRQRLGKLPLDILDALTLAVLVGVSYALFIRALSVTPLLPGIDGPYYAVQVRWLFEYGRLKYLDPPLTFYLMAILSTFTGDIFTGVKVTVALFTALTSIPLYVFFREVYDDRLGGMGATIAFALNFYTYRLLGDFMKNSIGLLWLCFYFYFLYKYWTKGDRSSFVFSSAFLILAALTHVLDYGVCVLFATLMPFTALILRRESKRAFIAFAVCALTLLFFFTFPVLIGYDVFKGLWFVSEVSGTSSTPSGSPSPLFLVEFLFRKGVAAWLSIVILLVLGLEGVYRKDYHRGAFLLILAGIGAFLNFPLLPRRWLFRFQLMSCIPIAFATGALVSRAKELSVKMIIVMIFVALLFSTNPFIDRGLRPSIPPGEYREIRAVIERFVEDRENVVLVVPDVRVKYWVETFADNVVKRPPRDFTGRLLLMLEKRHLRWVPPRARPVYIGKFIIVFDITVHHRRM